MCVTINTATRIAPRAWKRGKRNELLSKTMSSEKKLYYEIQMEMIFESMYFNEILIGFLSKGKIFRVVKLSCLI